MGKRTAMRRGAVALATVLGMSVLAVPAFAGPDGTCPREGACPYLSGKTTNAERQSQCAPETSSGDAGCPKARNLGPGKCPVTGQSGRGGTCPFAEKSDASVQKESAPEYGAPSERRTTRSLATARKVIA